MDRKKLEEAARLIIEAVGDDPGREGLLETPKRFADMMEEQFKYCSISNDEIAREFDQDLRITGKRHGRREGH